MKKIPNLCIAVVATLLCFEQPFAACVDEGNGDAWGGDSATNQGCSISGMSDPDYCRDDEDGDPYGKRPETGEVCELNPVEATTPAITSFNDGARILPTQIVEFTANSTVVFEWWLRVGATRAGNDYFDSGRLAADTTQQTISDLPTGEMVHITLHYKDTSQQWATVHYTASVAMETSGPVITNLADGSTVNSSPVIKYASNGTIVRGWVLRAGSVKGGSDYYDSGAIDAETTQHTIVGLPSGETAHITLYYKALNGEWIGVNYTAKVDSGPAGEPPATDEPAFTNVVDGSTIQTTQLVEFSDNGAVVKDWIIRAGSSEGSYNYFNSGSLGANASAHTVSGLPAGATVYLTLYHKDSSYQWVAKSYALTTAGEQEPGPGDSPLQPSGPIDVTTDGVDIENLDITATSPVGCGIRIADRKNITIRNVNIRHAGIGICMKNAQNISISRVSLINTIDRPGPHCKPNVPLDVCKTAKRDSVDGAETDLLYRENGNNNIHINRSSQVEVDTAYLIKGEAGIYVKRSPGTKLKNVHCEDIRGPHPRGQCVMFDNGSHNSTLTNFYAKQFLDTSTGHDNISAYDSDDIRIFNGLVDGNWSVNGVGVIADSRADRMSVEKVDLLRQGTAINAWHNGKVQGPDGSAYAGVPDDFTAKNIRVRDTECEKTWKGPGVKPSSGGKAFSLHPYSKRSRILNSQYWNHTCSNPLNVNSAVVKEIEKAYFEPMGSPAVIDLPWLE